MNALVTGGTAGVGLSIVRALVREGTFVHFVGTNADKGARIEAELNTKGVPSCRFIRLDLSEIRGVSEFAERFSEEVPTLDVLVNVAGVLLPTRQQTPEGFEKTWAIGHLAPFVLCRGLAETLARAPHGRIANVSGRPSLILERRLDFDNLQLHNGYSMTRAAIRAVHAKTVMTQILADELRERGVDVNAFHPGGVKSDLLRNLRFPLNLLSSAVQLFMADESKSGVYLTTSDAVTGTTGHFFVGTRARPLDFDDAYRARLLDATEVQVSGVLG